MAETSLDNLATVAQAALAAAKKAGAAAAAAHVTRSRFVDVAFRDDALEKAQASTRQELSLRLFVEGRYAAHSTSDLRPEALAGFVGQAAALTRLLEPDPLRSLADPARLARPPAPELGLYDENLRQSPAQRWVDLARSLEGLSRAAGAATGELVSASGNAYMEVSQNLLATSDGFLGHQEETGGFAVTGLVLMDPTAAGKRRSGYWWRGGHGLAGLDDERACRDLAQEAARRALRQCGARPGPSGRWPVLVENLAAQRLVGDLLACLAGPTLQQGKSYLRDSLGKSVAAPILTIRDEPLMPGGFGSRWYDGEGVAARPLALIEAGVLANFYLDTYHARKLGLMPTTGGGSNVTLASTRTGGFEQMLTEVQRGLAVTGFLGGNFNSTTGDFSYGVQGLWLEGGQVAHAVEGMNLAGNFAGLWGALIAVGDDPFPYAKLRAPSLLFGEAQLGGGPLA
ncbi:MAG: TldD/PmbA family protein [Thermodesulfobacteriota bacterium]